MTDITLKKTGYSDSMAHFAGTFQFRNERLHSIKAVYFMTK